ncbi:unnamed protein product [Caenorhabditis sp. 36 PRJEB53466]|nr:unnamed protein product [Caenorhabditis sp. 36 PRJEB53466]
MAKLGKFFTTHPEDSTPSEPTKVSVPAALISASSSVSPHCAWVAKQTYYRDRRLVTRTDVRARMSVWSRLFGWCSGGTVRQPNPENETIFTIRP